MSNNVEEKILHGTTTVGIKATDGVVLCADMRASAGYFIANNNTMKKFNILNVFKMVNEYVYNITMLIVGIIPCLLYTSPSPRDS